MKVEIYIKNRKFHLKIQLNFEFKIIIIKKYSKI